MLAAASAVTRRKLERHRCPTIAALSAHPLWQYERNLQRMDPNRSRAESIRCSARQPGSARWAGGLQPLRQTMTVRYRRGLAAHCTRPPVRPGQKVTTPATNASNSRAMRGCARHRLAAASDGPGRAGGLPAAAEQIFEFLILANVYKEDPSLV